MKKPKSKPSKQMRYDHSTFEVWEERGERTRKVEALTDRVPSLEVEEVTLADLLADYDPAVLREWLREQEEQERQLNLSDKPSTNEE